MNGKLRRLRNILAGRANVLLGMKRSVAISLLLHLSLLIISGYVILLHVTRQPTHTFISEAPRRPTLEPRKLEMKVRVQDLQKQSSRPRMQPRLAAAALGELSLPDLNVQPQVVRQTISAKVSTFGVSGFGTGIGGGLGTGSGGGFGTSQVNFFGLKDASQRIAILVDVSESMCEDSRGYPRGYQRVKFRLRDVVSLIADGTFFNVTAFARGVRTCFPKLILADPDTRARAQKWIDQFNNLEGPFGMRDSNYWPGEWGIKGQGGSTRLDLALNAAFEQGADTIFVITDGVPWVYKLLEGDELQTYTEKLAAWREARAKFREAMDKHQESEREKERREREFAKRKEAWQEENERRIKKGLGPKVVEGGGGPSRGGGGPSAPPRPRLSDEDILKHIEMLQVEFRDNKGRSRSRIHVIGYAVNDRTENFLRELARNNKGRFRRIRAFM
ncbi:MAG: hypothetical protein JXR37_32000 [Kiritimatiellae bacterium]|nr:hypothetical protein [Kiritimatiellia bacterium]